MLALRLIDTFAAWAERCSSFERPVALTECPAHLIFNIIACVRIAETVPLSSSQPRGRSHWRNVPLAQIETFTLGAT